MILVATKHVLCCLVLQLRTYCFYAYYLWPELNTPVMLRNSENNLTLWTTPPNIAN